MWSEPDELISRLWDSESNNGKWTWKNESIMEKKSPSLEGMSFKLVYCGNMAMKTTTWCYDYYEYLKMEHFIVRRSY